MSTLTRVAGFLAVAAGALAATAGSAIADVYTLTSTPAGNAVAVFDRAGNGTLEPAGSVLTGGRGLPSGGQGALALDDNRLVAVNAGSNTVSLFRIDGHGPGLRDVEPSGGVAPPAWRVCCGSSRQLAGGGGPCPRSTMR